MLFDTKTPSHLLAWRAAVWHLPPLSIFAAGYACDPALRLWSSPEGHIALVVLFDLLVVCTLLSLVAFVKACDELVRRRILIFPLLAADALLTVFVCFRMHAGG